MSIRRLFTINNFKGILEKASARDIPDTSLVKCENWDIDAEYGKLKSCKGWSDLLGANFGSGKGRGMVEVEEPRDAEGAAVLLAQDTDTRIARWRYDPSTGYSSKTQLDVTTISSGAEIDDLRLSTNNGNFFGGTGVGDNNIPIWYGYLSFNRFYKMGATGEADTDYYENISGYYLEEQELKAPVVGLHQDGEAISTLEDLSIAPDGTAPSGIMDDPLKLIISCTFLYEDGQESELPRDDAGNIIGLYETYDSGYTQKVWDTYPLNLYINPSISKRVVGINLYVIHESEIDSRINFQFNNVSDIEYKILRDGYAFGTAIKFWRTIPIDETKVREYNSYHTTQEDLAHTQWELQTSGTYNGWYKFIPDSTIGNTDNFTYYKDRDYNGAWHSLRTAYNATKNTMPKYKYTRMIGTAQYVAPVRYGDDYYPDLCVYSPEGSPNLLPDSSFIKIDEPISGIGSLRGNVVIFSETSLNIFSGKSFKQNYSEYGCVSHDGIIEHSGVLYWPGKYGFNAFDGFYPRSISAVAIDDSYNDLTLANKRSIVGVLDLENNNIVWSLSGGQMFIYNLDTKHWTVRTSPLEWLTRDARQDIIVSSGTDIFKWNDGYAYYSTFSGIALTKNCDAKTKKIDLREPGVIKTLTMGYISYKADSSFKLRIINNDTTLKEIDFSTQSAMNEVQFSLAGIGVESFQIQLYAANNDGNIEIDYIDIWGTVNAGIGG